MTLTKPCRHEFIRIYQRKLQELERRLCVTKAYLPMGFKPTDLNHLGEGSFAFCSNCRLRLYPRRTNAEKLASRQAVQAEKAALRAQLAGVEEVQSNFEPLDEQGSQLAPNAVLQFGVPEDMDEFDLESDEIIEDDDSGNDFEEDQ